MQSDGRRHDKFVVECKGKELLTFKTRDQSNVVFKTLKLWLRFGNKGRQKKEQMTTHYFVAKRLGVHNFHVPNTSCKI
jgi:hypothetical protein